MLVKDHFFVRRPLPLLSLRYPSDMMEGEASVSVEVKEAPSEHGEGQGAETTDSLSKIGLKAGMHGLDKAKVNQIIFEASKGSKFYENELRKDEQIAMKVKSMMKRVEMVTTAQKSSSLKIVDRDIQALEKARDLSHVIVHVDMDAFYAAVEMRDDPKLKSVPMAVGSSGMLVRVAC